MRVGEEGFRLSFEFLVGVFVLLVLLSKRRYVIFEMFTGYLEDIV